MALSLTRTAQPSTSNADANLNNNWTAIENLLNGNLDTTNLKTTTAGITVVQLAAAAQLRLLPASPSTNNVAVWNGSAWVSQKLANAQVDDAAAIAVTKLAGGTDGQQLSSAGTTPTWVTVPAARVYRTTDQALTDGASPVITFDQERFDTDTIHDTGSNTSRLTCKTAGIYAIGSHVEFEANATGRRTTTIRLNGTTTLAIARQLSVTGAAGAGLAVTTLYQMAVNDYVETTAFQNSGGTLSVLHSDNYSPDFWMVRVG